MKKLLLKFLFIDKYLLLKSPEALAEKFLKGNIDARGILSVIKVADLEDFLAKIQRYIFAKKDFNRDRDNSQIFLFSPTPIVQEEIGIFLENAGYYDYIEGEIIPRWTELNSNFGGIISVFEQEHPRFKGSKYFSLFVNKRRLLDDIAKSNLNLFGMFEYDKVLFIELG